MTDDELDAIERRATNQEWWNKPTREYAEKSDADTLALVAEMRRLTAASLTIDELRVLSDKLMFLEDEGPTGEGWQSRELSAVSARIEEIIKSQ